VVANIEHILPEQCKIEVTPEQENKEMTTFDKI
jgi:hypothetical protein